MKNYFQKNQIKILISLGVAIYFICVIITQTMQIPTKDNLLAFLITIVSFTPIICGLWIYSKKVSESKKTTSKIIKCLIIFFIVVILGTELLSLYIKQSH